jgi:hypothetical protein
MSNCGCNTRTNLIDKNTVKCKTKSCSENSDLISLVLISKTIDDKLTEFVTVINDFQTAMLDFCAGEGARFELIGEHVDTIIQTGENCCELINDKLVQIGDLIENLEIGEIPTTTVEFL